ncbi:hypothetical protein SKAU_G00169180 [Synaphobranchus kaupii]|uniref:Vomeronasal type-1 receptor n=1 Tax=Synaphobranchus kaupii TaxID=118154 RepID=A0A9Q1J071_SYNKA|nr:hypothetical protein SKAU_G00169180 [Synaphobranchus kaupii]
MEVRLALKAAGFIGLDVVGIPGNLAVLLLFCHLFLAQGHIPHNEFILSQLVFANLMVTLCRGIPQALTALSIDLFFGEHACRAMIFAYRLGRAMSITLTSLLSSYQCVVIAPPTPGWTWLKRWLPGHLPHAIVFLYGLNMIVHSTAILFTHAVPANSSLPEFTINLKFCIVVFPGHIAYRFCGVVYMVRDFAFVALMVWAAVYVMLVLHRHRKQVQGLQGGRPEDRGGIACRPTADISYTRVFFASCYSAISPVLIIATNKKLSTCLRCGSKRKAAENVPSSAESKASLVTITQ